MTTIEGLQGGAINMHELEVLQHELEVLPRGEMEESKQSGNVTGLLAQNRNSLGKGKQQNLRSEKKFST